MQTGIEDETKNKYKNFSIPTWRASRFLKALAFFSPSSF